MAKHGRPSGRAEKLRLDQLTIDPAMQQRAEGTDPDHAEDIRRAFKEHKGKPKGMKDPHVRRVTDPETKKVTNYVTDGFHTVEGARRAGVKELRCNVLSGTYEDAFYESLAANADQLAKNRSIKDKENAVLNCLKFNKANGVRWSYQKVADTCRVHVQTVKAVMERHPELKSGHTEDEPAKVVGTDGKERAVPRPTRRTAERSAADPEVPVTLAGGWREMPLTEFLDAEDYMWKNFKLHKIETAGQLHDAMRKGRMIGFMGSDRNHCWEQLEKIRTEQEVKQKPVKQGQAVYDWPKMETYFGVIVRMVDDLGRAYPDADKPQVEACHRNLDAFKTVLDDLKAKLTKSEAK